jgi:hypothetical protein
MGRQTRAAEVNMEQKAQDMKPETLMKLTHINSRADQSSFPA